VKLIKSWQVKSLDDSELVKQLCRSLTVLAHITGGMATVTDSQGRRLKTVDSHGQEIDDYSGQVYELAEQAAKSQLPMFGPSQFLEQAEAWALPIGRYVIACSNIERVERDIKLKEALTQALPLIARVAGGEAVLFDQDGRRLDSVDHTGQRNQAFIGKISKAASEAMHKQKPIIGQSMSVPGGIAVRLPITEKYGLGFNNEVVVSQKYKLFEEVKKSQYARYNFDDIIGISSSIEQCKSKAKHVAQSISSVLIYGETGTGKELFAQAIHNESNRRDKPFVAINCGALPASLIEGNLFGYVEGSFTGAKKGGSAGIFEDANNGTVFLDEISEMELDLQAKLLRVIQEREVTRIGSTKPIPVNVRILASSNKDLRVMVKERRFREDLFYRLNVVELNVPPLRERVDDIPFLAEFFVQKYNRILGKFIIDISPQAMDVLKSYSWPGNVRELQNCIESGFNFVSVNDHTLTISHLPSQFHSAHFTPQVVQPLMTFDLEATLREVEKGIIVNVLAEEKNNRKRAAKRLGLSITTLWRKMKEHNLLDNSNQEA